MPADGVPSKLGESNALTLLLGNNNKLFYYEGNLAGKNPFQKIKPTGYGASGLRTLIQNKQRQLGIKKNDLMLLIKPSSGASYQNVMAVLDEVLINEVKRYAIADMALEEEAGMKK